MSVEQFYFAYVILVTRVWFILMAKLQILVAPTGNFAVGIRYFLVECKTFNVDASSLKKLLSFSSKFD